MNTSIVSEHSQTKAGNIAPFYFDLEFSCQQILKATNWQANVITDGLLTCSYQEIPEIFANLERYLAKRIGVSDCLAVEADNTVPSVLFLLFLLSKGYSFLLLPKATNQPQFNKNSSMPRFCRYKITTESFIDSGNKVACIDPEHFLRVSENEQCLSEHAHRDVKQKIYLRTSGSTGQPKLVVHTHARLKGNVLNCVQRLKLNSDDRIAIPVPIAHMYGLGAALLPSLAVGASIDLQKGSNLVRYLQREREFNPNVAFLTPIFCETLLKGRKSLRTYKLTVAAGDRIKEDTFEKFESRFGCLVKLYGSTEMGAIAASSPDEPSEARSKTVGKPMPGVRMHVEQGSEAAKKMERMGELWCQHEYGFEGYIDEKDRLVRLDRDGWFCTKDWGCIWEDGHLEVLGRCDHSVNRDGLLVFFSDVEKKVETIKGIDAVAVVSKGESKRGKGLVAYCVLAQNTQMTAADIRTSCFDILPRHAIPDRIFIANSLPMLANGKIDRQKLLSVEDAVND